MSWCFSCFFGAPVFLDDSDGLTLLAFTMD